LHNFSYTTQYFAPNLEEVIEIVEGMDLIWIERGAGIAKAFF